MPQRPVYPLQPNWSHPVNKGLVAWWPMLEQGGTTLRDIAGTFHSSITSSNGWGVVSQEHPRFYIDIDHVDDVISLPTEREFSSSSKISIFAWINPDNLNDFHTIACKRTGGTASYQFRVGASSGADNLVWTWTDSSAFQIYNAGPTTVPTGSWFHAGVVFDWADPGNVTFYYDGVEYARTRSSGTGTTPDDAGVAETIGRRSDNSMNFNGQMSDIRFYDRTLTSSEVRQLYQESRRGYPNLLRRRRRAAKATAVTAAITGTATASIVEADVVAGGKTIIITLTGDTFKAAGTGPIGSTADTNALLAGITSAQSELTGWNNEVRDNLTTTDIVRTSDTVATVTLPGSPSYDITAQETITVTVPTDVLVTAAGAIVATPTFTVDIDAAGGGNGKNHLLLLGVG